jgi:hypothetical protein
MIVIMIKEAFWTIDEVKKNHSHRDQGIFPIIYSKSDALPSAVTRLFSRKLIHCVF